MSSAKAAVASGAAAGGNTTEPPAAAEGSRVSLLWAVQAHAADIARLHAAMFESPWDEAAIAALLAHPGSVALIATRGAPRDIRGFALAQVAADEAEILTIGVDDSARGGGVGQHLVEGIMRAAGRAGAKAVFLEVAESNAAARALYAKTGFAEVGRRKGYYLHQAAPPEDALVLKAACIGAG